MNGILDGWVREATPADTEVVRSHEQAAALEASRYRGRIAPQETDGQRQLTLVAGFGETVMGSITALETAPSVWLIVHVHVEDKSREVGLGDMLLSACLETISGLGGSWCGARALPGDRAMKNLFERHGLVAQTIVVGKSLNDPSNGADVSR